MVKKVLIIEDDRDTLDALTFIAEDLNLEVTNSSRIILVADIEALSPQLILLDHWVHGSIGGDLCLAIKADPAIKHIPVILVSAHSNIQQLAIKCGADGFLEKPFNLEEITAVITKWLF